MTSDADIEHAFRQRDKRSRRRDLLILLAAANLVGWPVFVLTIVLPTSHHSTANLTIDDAAIAVSRVYVEAVEARNCAAARRVSYSLTFSCSKFDASARVRLTTQTIEKKCDIGPIAQELGQSEGYSVPAFASDCIDYKLSDGERLQIAMTRIKGRWKVFGDGVGATDF